jgi:hypothetical protein
MSAEKSTALPDYAPKSWQERFSDWELEPTDDGIGSRLYGIEKETDKRTEVIPHYLEKNINNKFGVELKQEVPAIWHKNAEDIPVQVTGIKGTHEGVTYFGVEGSDTGIAETEIEWVKPEKSQATALTNEELTNELSGLHEQIRGMEETLQTITRQNQELTQRNQELTQRNKMLEALLRANGIAIPGEPEATPEAEPTETVSAPPMPEAKEPAMAVPISPETPEPAVEAEEAKESPDSERGNAWHRLSGRIGRSILGTQASLHNRLYNLTDRQGRREVIVEEAVDEERVGGYTEQERRAGRAAVIGGAALAGAGVLVGWLIWGRHGGHDVINHYYSNGTEVTGPPVPGGGGGPSTADTIGGSHIDYFNDAIDRRRTGVMLPQELHLQNVSGHQAIVDNQGNIVVGHNNLPDGIADRQGNLSIAARKKLRAMGYALDQTKLGGRFMTFVQGR